MVGMQLHTYGECCRAYGECLPRLRRAFAVKMNSDGQNSFSHYPRYVDINFRSVTEPSPRGEGGPRQRWMRCAHAEGMGVCATTVFADITFGVLFTVLHKFHLTKTCHHGSAYFVGGTGTFCRRQNFSHITCDVTHSSPIGDTFPSQHLTFGQVRKALMRSTL